MPQSVSMWTVTTVTCWLALLHLPLSWCSGLKYASVRGEGSQPVQVTFDRFIRQEDEPTITQGNHTYYTSTYYPAGHPVVDAIWLDLASMAADVMVDDFTAESLLSGLHRFYEVHNLQFEFPFYGHIITSLAVTTGGFLYTGDLLHEQVAATQFIAPLQADFNPNSTDTGRVLVLSTEERFTVQWDKVHNHDHQDDGPFTFQVSIFPSGEIHFVYREIPLRLGEIDNEDHPVEVGLADAFYFYQRMATGILVHIFEYHRVTLSDSAYLNNSAYVLIPQLNCISATSCKVCSDINEASDFDCEWCDELNRCSDGVDRHRQEWFNSECFSNAKTTCTDPPSSPASEGTAPPSSSSSSSKASLSGSARAGISVAVIVVVIVSLLLILGGVMFCYAYHTPTSRMGQLMIKYRPQARTLNKNTKISYDVSTEKAILDEDCTAN